MVATASELTEPAAVAEHRFLAVGSPSFAKEVVTVGIHLGSVTLVAEDAKSALCWLRATAVELCLVDADTFGAGLSDIIEALRREAAECEIAVASSTELAATAVAALRSGAVDVLLRPLVTFDVKDVLARGAERQRRRFAASLHNATSNVFGAEREALPSLVVEAAAAIMQADDASLLLPDGEGNLYLAHSTNPEAMKTRGKSMPMDSCIAGRVATLRRPVVLLGAFEGDAKFASLPRSGRPASSLVYPLLRGKALAGVLTLNRGPARPVFVDDDIERATLLAMQVALALDNLRLVHTVAGGARLAAVGELAAGLVHEITNPLSCVLANLELARAELLSLEVVDGDGATRRDAISQLLDDTFRGVDRIMELVRDVRLLSRSDERHLSVFDLGDAVRSALRVARASLHDTLEVNLDLAPELFVEGNPGQLSQAIYHLLANAEQAMRVAKSSPRLIELRAFQEGERVILEVRDSGPGIPASRLGAIFEAFVTTKAELGHVGLGLTMSREIVARHGGTLHASCGQGGGAIFTIDLPTCSPDGRRAA